MTGGVKEMLIAAGKEGARIGAKKLLKEVERRMR